MTVYTPSYTVSVNGEDLVSAVVDEFEINIGRNDVQNQPYPSTLQLRVYSNVGSNFNFALDDLIQIDIDNIRAFVGWITSIDISMTAGINNQNIAYYEISAAGALAFLSRTDATQITLPTQGDLDRITELLIRAFALLWTDMGSSGQTSLQWKQFDPTITWAGIQPAYPFGPPVFNGTNTYTISELTPTTTDTLTLAQETASSAKGILYDSRDGQIYYDTYLARLIPTNTITITSDMVLTESIVSNMNIGDLVNIVNVEITGGSVAQATNQPSIDLYGPRVATKYTTLEELTEGQSQANEYVYARAIPQYSIRQFTIPLHLNELDPTIRGELLFMDLNTAMIWPSTLLPEPLKQYTDTTNFVEGWTIRANRTSIFLTINQSPKYLTYGHKMWLEYSNLITWNTEPATTQWKDA
jgi:hypothetical protein